MQKLHNNTNALNYFDYLKNYFNPFNALNLDHFILNIRLVRDLNRIPKHGNRHKIDKKHCAIHRWGISEKVRSRLIHYHICIICL